MKPDDITKTLDCYIEWKKPDYAVLLTGGWGTGKTYYIRGYIDRLRKAPHKKKIVYCSLYGIKNESDIENKIWAYSIKWKPNLWCLIIFVTIVLGATITGICLSTSKTEMIVNILFHSIGVLLLSIAIWYYKTFKETFIGFNLSKTALIVFDDFERADMSHELLLAYINRYVEHLNRHVIIVCNDNEIKEQTEKESSFKKIQEKVIGQRILLEQDTYPIMETIMSQGHFSILNYITELSKTHKEFFYTLSHPHGFPLNYRVWSFCCRSFENAFAGIPLDFFDKNKVITELLPNYFSLVYALQIYDFGNKLIFSREDARSLFLGKNNGATDDNIQERFKWFYDCFVLKPETKDILPDSIWDCIIDDQHFDIKEIIQHWDLLFDKKQPLWLRIYDYSEKSDNEMKATWEELKKAYHLRTIQNPSQIVSIFSSVDNMVLNKCCLKVFRKDLTHSLVLRLALRYVRYVKLSSSYDIRPIIGKVFSSCETYGHHACEQNIAQSFREAFELKCNEFDIKVIIPKRFDSFLNILALPEYSFDAHWHVDKLKEKSIFEGQSSKRLLDKLLELPSTLLRDRLYLIIDHIFVTHYRSKAYAEFGVSLLRDIKTLVQKAEKEEIKLQMYQVFGLQEAARSIKENFDRCCYHLPPDL